MDIFSQYYVKLGTSWKEISYIDYCNFMSISMKKKIDILLMKIEPNTQFNMAYISPDQSPESFINHILNMIES